MAPNIESRGNDVEYNVLKRGAAENHAVQFHNIEVKELGRGVLNFFLRC